MIYTPIFTKGIESTHTMYFSGGDTLSVFPPSQIQPRNPELYFSAYLSHNCRDLKFNMTEMKRYPNLKFLSFHPNCLQSCIQLPTRGIWVRNICRKHLWKWDPSTPRVDTTTSSENYTQPPVQILIQQASPNTVSDFHHHQSKKIMVT